jgi:hypothetical protein
MAVVEFTGNYQDLSTDRGFQFKFFCEKCNNGYMSTFQTSKIGMAASAMEVAGSLFGGLLGRAASSAYEVQRAVGGPLHDSALKSATEEIRPLFQQCKRCGRWVCKPVCFNDKAQLCSWCAPDLQQEMAVAQAEAAKEQVYERAREVDWLKGQHVETVSGAACRNCGAKNTGGKFCGECGAPFVQTRHCTECGASIEGAPKFCPECGHKV